MSSHSEIKKNKSGLANFIPRKFVPFLSASVILDSTQTLMWHCQAFFLKKKNEISGADWSRWERSFSDVMRVLQFLWEDVGALSNSVISLKRKDLPI